MNRIIYKGIIFLTLLILVACSLEEPALPTWLAQWTVPFESSYIMREVLEEPNFTADTTSDGQTVVAISVKDSTEERTVSSSDLSIRPDSDRAGATLDALSLGTLGPENSNKVPLGSILGVTPQVGVPIVLPQTTIDLDLVYLLYVDLGWAEIKSGTFKLEFFNHTFLSIQSGMQIDIYNDSTDVLVGTSVFPDPIEPMSSGIATPHMDLSGEIIHTRFLLRIHMPIDAVNHVVVEEDLDDEIWISGTLEDLSVSRAEAIFPPQYMDIKDSTSVMDQEHRVRWAEIDYGKLDMVIHNKLDIMANISVKLLNITNEFGEVLTETLKLPAMETTNTSIELDDYIIADYPDRNSGELIDYLRYEVYVETDTTGEFTILSEDDSVSVEVNPDSIFFSKIDGQVNDVEIEIDPVIKDDLEDLSKIDGTIYLDSLRMILDVHNGTGIPVFLTLNISGTDGIEQVILAPIEVEATGFEVTRVTLDANDPSPNIIDLMAILPKSIRLDATAMVDGDGSVEVGQVVRADYQIFSPLFLRIQEASYLESEIQEEVLNEDVKNNIEDNIKNAVVYFEVVNGLPVGASGSIYVATDSTDLYSDQVPDSTKKFIISDIDVSAAQVDNNGFVSDETTSDIQEELTETQLHLFTNDTVYIGTKIRLYETDGLVKFRLKDRINTLGHFQFDFMMNNEDEKE